MHIKLAATSALAALAITVGAVTPAGAQIIDDRDLKAEPVLEVSPPISDVSMIDLEDRSVYVDKTLRLSTTRLGAVTAGDTAWVLLHWTALADIDSFRLNAYGSDGVTVGYPENTRDHASLSKSYALAGGRSDFVALQVTVPATAQGSVYLETKLSWKYNGETRSAGTALRIPVVQHTGADYAIADFGLRDAENGDVWVEIVYRGLAPRLEQFRVTIPEATELGLYLPRKDYSSLSADDVLEDGETDTVRFRVNPKHMEDLIQMVFVTEYSVSGEHRGEKAPLDFLKGLLR